MSTSQQKTKSIFFETKSGTSKYLMDNTQCLNTEINHTKTNSATTNYPTNNLSTKFNINPNVSVPVNLVNVKGDAKFIPQHM